MMPGAGSLPVHSAHSHGTYHSGEGSTSGFKLPDVSGLYASVTQVLARVQSRTPWHNRGSGSSTAAVVTGQSGSERQPLLPEGQRLGGSTTLADNGDMDAAAAAAQAAEQRIAKTNSRGRH
eukprot:jgi/Chrzof1/14426/Cz09g02140.t1